MITTLVVVRLLIAFGIMLLLSVFLSRLALKSEGYSIRALGRVFQAIALFAGVMIVLLVIYGIGDELGMNVP